jgi:hypothetical protein
MDAVLECRKFDNDQIRQINYCKLYLQATTLSDITLATGTELDPTMMTGRPSELSSTSK